MNLQAIKTIYNAQIIQTRQTLSQSILAPVLSTALYCIVFGAAIGSSVQEVDGVSYGAFIVPGLIMMTILTESISTTSFAIYVQKFSGTIYELLSAPISMQEIVLGYVGAAVTKSFLLGLIILVTAAMIVPLKVIHPFLMIFFLLLMSVMFSLLGLIIGIWADSFDQLQLIPQLIAMPLLFLGGCFYSISILPPIWQSITYFNPVLYLVSGFRYCFYEITDVNFYISLSVIFLFISICILILWWTFKTGYRLKS